MPLSKHSIDVLEAGYRLDSTDGDWLHGLLRAMYGAPLMGGHRMRAGAFAFHVSSDGQTFATRDYTLLNAPDELGQIMRHRHSALSPAEIAVRYWGQPVVCATLSQRRLAISQQQQQAGVTEFLGLQVTDMSGAGCCLVFELPERTVLRPNQVAHWEALGHHVRAGLRVRRKLARSDPWAHADAIIDMGDGNPPGGRVVHARGQAASRDAGEALRRHALAMDRARARCGCEDREQALRAWDGLLAGDWTMVERFDSDGRRFYIAIRNPPEVAHLLRLTERERKVVELASEGLLNREIADALGLSSESAVNTYLLRALAKLRVGSREELAVLAGELDISPMPLGQDQLLLMRLPADVTRRFERWALTAAETEIALCILRGYSSKAIAAERGSKARTVANQIQSLFDKLGVDTRTEIAATLV